MGVASSVANNVIMRTEAASAVGARRRNDNDVIMIIAGVWRYGDMWPRVATLYLNIHVFWLTHWNKTLWTRSTGTVHTSAKARLTHIHDRERHQNLTIRSLAHCQPSLKISCKSLRKFLRKVANRQTHRQTNNDDYLSFLADVTMHRVNGIAAASCHKIHYKALILPQSFTKLPPLKTKLFI